MADMDEESLDKETPERTIKALEYNIQCKQQMIDKLINDNVDLEEKVKTLEKEGKGLREEVIFLEHLRNLNLTKS